MKEVLWRRLERRRKFEGAANKRVVEVRGWDCDLGLPLQIHDFEGDLVVRSSRVGPDAFVVGVTVYGERITVHNLFILSLSVP